MTLRTTIELALVILLAACGGKQQPPPNSGSDTPIVAKDTRTPLEKRRDDACKKLGPKITQCAVEDAKKDLAAGKVTQKQFDQDTSPDVQKKNSEKFIENCGTLSSSRQVRVLEVCLQQETVCDPLLDCLAHLNDKPAP